MKYDTFESFNVGELRIPGRNIPFEDISWSKHPVFEGVELKHIVTSKDTDGKFSYHLVRIAPGCVIKDHIHADQIETHEVIEGEGLCINNRDEITYEPGVISLMPAGVPHEVWAGEKGLCMFAKFIPALC